MKLGEYLDADWRRYLEMSGKPVAKRGLVSMCGPRTLPVLLVRMASACHRGGFTRIAKVLSAINLFMFSLEVPTSLDIAPGLILPHPQGTILGARRIGKNAMIYQQVTLGAREADFGYHPELRPDIGDNVTIAAGAKVLGGIRLGDNCLVGANAVVLVDVPDGHRAVGVPARILPPRDDEASS
jgi:serine O-acetyltransferase